MKGDDGEVVAIISKRPESVIAWLSELSTKEQFNAVIAVVFTEDGETYFSNFGGTPTQQAFAGAHITYEVVADVPKPPQVDDELLAGVARDAEHWREDYSERTAAMERVTSDDLKVRAK